MFGSGSASSVEVEVDDDEERHKRLQNETDRAVAAILGLDNMETVEIRIDENDISNSVSLGQIDQSLGQDGKGHKRTRSDENNGTNIPFKAYEDTQNNAKKRNTRRIRYYNDQNKGPFEIIIQHKEGKKINPHFVGKVIKLYHNQIDHISRSGKNIIVTCKDAKSANDLINSPHLSQFSVFVPANRVETTGVVYIEPEITEEEVLNDTSSPYPIVRTKRITRFKNNEVSNTHYMSITFDSDQLPEYIYLNYVRMPVDPYMIPVKQCYICFKYGHTARAPCQNDKVCKDCGQKYHGSPCTKEKKCVNCCGMHSSNSKACPEYLRQKNIMERMSLFKEDYITASQKFPTATSQKPYAAIKKSYAEITSIQPTKQFLSPVMEHPSNNRNLATYNKFSSLGEIENCDTSCNSRDTPFNTKPKSYQQTKPRQDIPSRPPPQNEAPIATTANPASEPSIQDNSYLKKLLNEKIKDLRNKISTERFINKNKVDELLLQLLKDLGLQDNIKPVNSSTTLARQITSQSKPQTQTSKNNKP